MPPVVIDIRSAEDSRDVVHRAVQALVEGKLVAFPTETVYVLAASALCEPAVERLAAVHRCTPEHPLTLAVKSAAEAQDYVPEMSPLGMRLARRCWPGPVTLVVADDHPESVVRQLPTAVREAVTGDGMIGLRVPAHAAIHDVLRMIAGPIVLSTAQRDGTEAVTAQQVVEQAGDDVQLVLDDGRSRFGQPASVVRVRDKQLDVLRAGVVSEQNLRRLSSLMILFVCTGNTCRSPMAERICRHLLAERLRCKVEELPDRGVMVVSAGTSGMMGGRAAREAVQVLSMSGIDLADHETRPLTAQLVRHADFLLVMTRAHRQAILTEWPEAAERTRLVCHSGQDVADPIGGPAEEYQRCAAQIRAELEAWVDEFQKFV
ncbi:MAG: Sua5/YciO/YrdC/YwlC family protein [Planctomycetes bacterium]|nr:Sua5/YciO/YrdC/YwlC family protein [Planctomycetota bacterium]